jgi:hypothetical protein
MKRFQSRLVLPLLLGLLAAGVVIAQSPDTQGPGPNVEITITVGKLVEGKPQVIETYRLLARAGSESRLLIGWRTPIPTARTGGTDAGKVTAFTYQNVGMTTNLKVELIDAKTVLLRGELELSGADDESEIADAAPVIGTFQQGLDVVVSEGKGLRIAEVPDPEGGTRFLEVEVDVLN